MTFTFTLANSPFCFVERAALCLACIAMLSSCGVVFLARHLKSAETRGSVQLHVTSDAGRKDVRWLALALEELPDGRFITVGGDELRADGFGTLELEAEKPHLIAAFDDANRNERWDGNELLDYRENIKPAATTSSLPTGTIELAPRLRVPPSGAELILPEKKQLLLNHSARKVAVGDVASLNDLGFASKTAWAGLWRPLIALREQAFGLYLTEPYDPARKPVIMVYGIGGSPRDWIHLSKYLDHSRHQFWFYHYPSGVRLGRAAAGLADAIRVMHGRYRFSQCTILAHSMGGLVARGSCLDLAASGDGSLVSRMITISTPWGGHGASESGLRMLKRPVPSWKDVSPGSRYLKALYEIPWPSTIRHDVIYGEKTISRPWLDGANDGVVTVASQTDARVLKDVSHVLRLEIDHNGILSSSVTTDAVNRFLR